MRSCKDIMKMAKSGELFYKIKQKILVYPIKNKIIKNKILEDKELRRLKRKYYKIIENREELSEKSNISDKVWVFWYQGLENAPDLIKKCVESTRKAFKDKEVVVLTKDNYKDYVQFPEYINKKFEKGIISYTHFSDLLRIELLARYGGTWCDATLFFTGEVPEYVTNSDLFVFKYIELDRNDNPSIVASNWFISAKSNNNIIVTTRDLLFEYYKRERFVKNYYFFHLFFKLVTDKYNDEWNNVPTFSNVNPHILQFELLDEYNQERFEQIKGISFVHKLNKVLENKEKDKKTFYDYIIEN